MKLTKNQMHKAIVNNMKEVREIATKLKLNDTEKFQLASRMAKHFMGDINKYFDRMRNNLYGVPKKRHGANLQHDPGSLKENEIVLSRQAATPAASKKN